MHRLQGRPIPVLCAHSQCDNVRTIDAEGLTFTAQCCFEKHAHSQSVNQVGSLQRAANWGMALDGSRCYAQAPCDARAVTHRRFAAMPSMHSMAKL